MEAYGAPFGIVLFLFVQLYVDHIARHYKGDKNHEPVDACHSHSFGTGIYYLNLLKQGQFLISSTHIQRGIKKEVSFGTSFN